MTKSLLIASVAATAMAIALLGSRSSPSSISAGYRVELMPPCKAVPPGVVIESGSVVVEVRSSGVLINGDGSRADRPLLETLKWVFSRRASRIIYLLFNPDLSFERVIKTIDEVQADLFFKRVILLTPNQIEEYRGFHCVPLD